MTTLAPTFTIGDRVRIKSLPHCRTSGGARVDSRRKVGDVGVVASLPDYEGDIDVIIDGDNHRPALNPACLEFETPPPASTLATATVRVDVRLFIGDVDVTDKLKGLLADA